MIGRIFGNRYRLVELIGEGGMALVYKAECSLLCRTVAIKILRPQYASDVEFVERFRREARSAASLSHPNVVNIYDVGQDDGIDYIVMEYISGANLKNIIRREAPFTISRALDYTKQIAEALNHAHQRNIIHRDIKPHNILVTEDGQIKVTDFGIARAISESSFTQTGIVVGSVQYASPEQVKGGLVGPASDLYSLGCVLYEMLSGTVPFKGDTSISIALQHLQEEWTPLSELRGDIPAPVGRILAKAMAKNLEERYPTALAMIKEIESVQAKIGREIPVADDDLPTQVLKRVGRAPKVPRQGWSLWWPRILIGVSAVAIVSVLMFGLFFYFLDISQREVIVPDVVGMELAEAREVLSDKQLRLKLVNQLYHADYPLNHVISQKPAAGFKKRPNSEVELVVSKGPLLVRVPDLTGKTQREAGLALEEFRLKLGEIALDTNPGYPEGVVIKQSPERDTQIEQGASVSVTLNVIKSEDLIEVPNFIGRALTEVRAELTALGLIYNQATPTPSNIYAQGVVVDQRPVPYDKVPPGTAMNFIVSSGPNG